MTDWVDPVAFWISVAALVIAVMAFIRSTRP